jgi:hypothetical protein
MHSFVSTAELVNSHRLFYDFWLYGRRSQIFVSADRRITSLPPLKGTLVGLLLVEGKFCLANGLEDQWKQSTGPMLGRYSTKNQVDISEILSGPNT